VRADLHEALSALADGEVADPERVAEALGEPDAALLLVTLAEARLRLRDTTSEPSADFARRVARTMSDGRRPVLLVMRRFTPALYAGLGLAAGILVSVFVMPGAVSSPPPIAPTSARVATAPPVPAPPTSLAPAPAASQVAPRRPAVPAARSVYRFEVGRNWKEGS
jgi:hypothetical protein